LDMDSSVPRNTTLALTASAVVAVLVLSIVVVLVFNASQEDEFEPSGTLRMGFMQKLDSMNPNVGQVDTADVFYGLVYDTLQCVDEDLGIEGNLATNAEVDESYEPYGSVWEMDITPNAMWHDGVPFGVDDVVFTINLQAEFFSQMWAYQPYAYFMNYAEKVDNTTVRIHFYDRSSGEPMPAAYAEMLCIPMLPEHMLGDWSAADIGFNWEGVFEDSDPPLVGTGPFMATENIYPEFLQGDVLTLVRNPNYHWTIDKEMEISFEQLEMHFFDDSTKMAFALENGELNVAQFPPQEYLTIKGKVQSGKLTDVVTYDGPRCTQYWTDLVINMNNAGLNPSRLDPVIRQAMAMATNKTYIVDDYYLGLAEEGSTLIPPVNTKWHYEPTDDELYRFDLAAANALLEDGGYRYTTESPDVRVCTADSYAVIEGLVPEGTPLEYEMGVRQEYPEEKDVAIYLQSEWANIGIDVDYRILSSGIGELGLRSYTYDALIWHGSSDPDPNHILFRQSNRSWNGWNDNRYSTPEYEENYTASVQALDYSERKGYVDACQSIHYRDVAYIIFACPYQTYAWRTDTFGGWGDWAENPGRSIDAHWSGNPLYFDLEYLTFAPGPEIPLWQTLGVVGVVAVVAVLASIVLKMRLKREPLG